MLVATWGCPTAGGARAVELGRGVGREQRGRDNYQCGRDNRQRLSGALGLARRRPIAAPGRQR